MYSNDARSMSRRTFTKYGALSTGLIAGSPRTAASADRGDADREDADGEQPTEGAMAPYQVVPEAEATVVERDIGWRPQGLDSYDRAHAISYDHAPSLRAVLLTDGPLRAERSVAIGTPREAVSETNRSLVTVGLDSQVADSGTE